MIEKLHNIIYNPIYVIGALIMFVFVLGAALNNDDIWFGDKYWLIPVAFIESLIVSLIWPIGAVFSLLYMLFKLL